jgi:hypothetical protein
MTSLAAAIAVDQRGPSALYIITDSRITWKGFAGQWDAGQKTYASQTSAHIFGFCGNASFPPSVIRQVIELMDIGLLTTNEDPAAIHSQVVELLEKTLRTASHQFFDGFSIFHGAREGELMSSKFRLWRTEYYQSTRKFYDGEIEMEKSRSCLVHIDGSGRSVVQNQSAMWDRSTAAGTSRAAMWAFCEALSSGTDRHTGGAPQMVGVWRKGPARRFGIVWNGKRYVAGIEVTPAEELRQIDWFNDLFERCDGISGGRLKGASSHEKPNGGP